MEIKNIALLRHELDRDDDAFVDKWAYREKLKEYIEQNSYRNKLRALRLQQRYFYNDTELTGKLERGLKGT